MTHADLERSIDGGSLPSCLVGGDPALYRGRDPLECSWDGWLRMWWGVTYVRMQGFERDEEAIWSSELPGDGPVVAHEAGPSRHSSEGSV